MPMNMPYHGPGDLPDVIPVFPLPGALLLPRGQMPLNIFEPRYVAMVDDVFLSGQRLIKDRVGGEEKDLLRTADAALVEGDPAGAAEIYAEILAEDSGNVHALAGLARCYVETGALDQAKQTLALVPESKRNESAVAAARAALDLAEQASALGPVTELERRVAGNPLDFQARFDLALAMNAQGQRGDAVDHLLEIVRRDRKWNDDGARKQLVQLFEAWGPTDEATIQGRRRLSSILFS